MKILVIDDDPLIIEFVRDGLRLEGCETDSALTGAEGRAAARSGSYDVIILDVGLPDATGFELANAIREDGNSTPILMLTARQGTDNLVQGLAAGADDYLTKPFDIRELCARVKALSRRAAVTEALVVGALSLNRINHEVRVGERRVRLTPKEYKLLEYFMLKDGEPVSRTELLEKVWSMNFDPQSNIVDVHIARLRSKLKRHPSAPQLETVRGFGFRLTSEPPAQRA